MEAMMKKAFFVIIPLLLISAGCSMGLSGPCNTDLLKEFESKSFADLSFNITKIEYED
jgi:hypothetical protein